MKKTKNDTHRSRPCSSYTGSGGSQCGHLVGGSTLAIVAMMGVRGMGVSNMRGSVVLPSTCCGLVRSDSVVGGSWISNNTNLFGCSIATNRV